MTKKCNSVILNTSQHFYNWESSMSDNKKLFLGFEKNESTFFSIWESTTQCNYKKNQSSPLGVKHNWNKIVDSVFQKLSRRFFMNESLSQLTLQMVVAQRLHGSGVRTFTYFLTFGDY